MESSARGRPKRVPKTEATTGLAPKKATATNPLTGGLRRCQRVLVLKGQPKLSLVEFRRSEGLRRLNATIAGPLTHCVRVRHFVSVCRHGRFSHVAMLLRPASLG